LTVAFFIETTKTAYQLKSNEVTVATINLAHELVILLIVLFVNNEHFVNAVTMGKMSHAEFFADKMRIQMLRTREQGFGAV